MVASSGFLATKVYGRKGGQSDRQALYVDDGVYGSFNHKIYDHAIPKPKLFEEAAESAPVLPTQIFGPTCDGLDQICEESDTLIPRVEVGDWLYWDEMGAYTHCGSFVFNGYTNIPAKNYVNTTIA
jgi:ornithine decarboxylase